VFFAWRPNLPDEADYQLVELAAAGNCGPQQLTTRGCAKKAPAIGD